MRNLKLYTSLIILLLLCSLNSYAQNFSEDYKKVFKTYLSCKQISLNMSYAVYADQTSKDVVQKEGGCFWMDGKKSYQKYMETENLESSPYHLYVDHKRKVMVLTEKGSGFQKMEKKEGKKFNPSSAMSMIDSSLPFIKTIEYKGEKEGIREYKLIPKSGEKEISLAIDTKTWLLNRVTIYSNSPVSSKGKTLASPRAEISYQQINLHPKFKANDFSITKYGAFIKGKFQMNPQYKGYKLDYKKT
jgi:outer membrane lipoprotein-sorting protein